jgi:hypothetical protein
MQSVFGAAEEASTPASPRRWASPFRLAHRPENTGVLPHGSIEMHVSTGALKHRAQASYLSAPAQLWRARRHQLDSAHQRQHEDGEERRIGIAFVLDELGSFARRGRLAGRVELAVALSQLAAAGNDRRRRRPVKSTYAIGCPSTLLS